METKRFGKGFEHYTPEEQARIALGREVAAEGMVLLENNGILPLKAGRKVASFGVGQIGFLHGGSGSGSTFADYVVKLPEAMENAGAVVDPYLTALYADYCAQEQKNRPICAGARSRKWFSPIRRLPLQEKPAMSL